MKRAALVLTMALLAACHSEPRQPSPEQPEQAGPAHEPDVAAAPHVALPDAPERPPVDPDPSLIEAAALVKLLAGEAPPTVIDVRTDAAWQASRIPGSINLPVHRLSTSAAPRAGAAIMVGDGWGSPRLDDEVAALRKRGLDVRALDGGMQAWCRAGGPTTAACAGADRIPPAATLSRFNCADRRVILALAADAPERARTKDVLPDALVVTPDAVTDTARRVTAEGLQLLVLADTDGAGCDALLAAARAGSSAHAFCVEGGLAALDVLARSQRAMATRTPLVSSGKAGTPHADGVRAPKGCGCR